MTTVKNPRPYQLECTNAVRAALAKTRSTLVTAATGTGKTFIFSMLTKACLEKSGLRVMILVDRIELVDQASRAVYEATGIHPAIERGDQSADGWFGGPPKVVIATFQTLANDIRLKRFVPDEFGLVIVDEAHLAITDIRLDIVRWFMTGKKTRLVGVTATPERLDGKSLAQMFESVAFEYPILSAISDGYLVPIRGRQEIITSVSLEGVGKPGRDYTDAELAELYEQQAPMVELVGGLLTKTEGRSTLAFCPSVDHAIATATMLNATAGKKIAAYVHGELHEDVRRLAFKQLGDGTIRILTNYGVATVGVDVPRIGCVANARPTKSRPLFTQMVGRGTRPLPGVVDAPGLDTPEQRKAAIAASAKPDVLVLSFVGRGEHMDLMGPEDALGGSLTEGVRRKIAKVREQGESYDPLAELERAEAAAKSEAVEERRRAAQLAANKAKVAKVEGQSLDMDLFSKVGTEEQIKRWTGGNPRAMAGLKILAKFHIPAWKIKQLGESHNPQAAISKMAGECIARAKAGRLTHNQEAVLRRHAAQLNMTPADVARLSKADAREHITKLREMEAVRA